MDILSIRQKLYIKYLLSKQTDKYLSINKSKKKLVIALAADYGNLGDVAITYAQTKYLKNLFPEAEIIDFPISETFNDMKSLKKIINKNDIITIVGGGNTGDMYDDIEYCRQFIIRQFPENKIISFPQTIDFSNTEFGKKSILKAKKIYNNHKSLILAAREKKSFEKYKKTFENNKIIFTPDIVLSLNKENPKYEREDITLCLRSDGEKKINKSKEKILIESLKGKYKIKYNDTHIDKNKMTVKEREIELEKIWVSFKKSKLVITDRLHGMIFCAITKTPCIALDNSNKKISGVYNAWLKEIEHIKMIEEYDIKKLQKNIQELLNKDISSYSMLDLNKDFNSLKECLF